MPLFPDLFLRIPILGIWFSRRPRLARSPTSTSMTRPASSCHQPVRLDHPHRHRIHPRYRRSTQGVKRFVYLFGSLEQQKGIFREHRKHFLSKLDTASQWLPHGTGDESDDVPAVMGALTVFEPAKYSFADSLRARSVHDTGEDRTGRDASTRTRTIDGIGGSVSV
jgi:hypothetical protein